MRFISGVRKKYHSLPVTIRGSLWFLICSFLQHGISFITTPIFTRLLSTAEYGQFSVFNSWLGIVSVVVTLNLSSGVFVQGLVKFDDEKSVFASSVQGLTLMLAIAWALVYSVSRDFWNNLLGLSTVQMYAMLIIIWAAAVFNFWSTEQRVDYKYKRLLLLTLLVSVLRPALGVFLVINAQDKVTARILGMATVDLVAYTGLFVAQMKRGKRFYSARFWRYAIRFNLPLIPHYLSGVILNSADRIMINNMVGASQAGIYSLAYSLAQIMTLFNSSLLQTLEPWLYKKIKAQGLREIETMAYPCFAFIACVNLLLIMLAPEAVVLFAPPEYYEAIYIIPPVAMSAYFTFAYSFFATFEFYYEKTTLIMFATVSGAVINIALNFALIPFCGYMAAGYTTLLCYMIYAVMHYLFMRKIARENMNGAQVYELRILLGMTVAFMVSGFLLLATYRLPVVRYAVIAITTIVLVANKGRIAGAVRKVMQAREEGKER